MESLSSIVEKIRRAERISPAEAVRLWREAPLWLLGRLATERKRAVSGDEVYYNRNIHIEPSNVCIFDCEFCSFRRGADDAEAWSLSLDEIEQRAREAAGRGVTEVHIVGGVHPDHTLDFYCQMIRRVKSAVPGAAVKAFTAVELLYMIRKAGLTVEKGLRRLAEAGMEAIPGGGAEIFDEELRSKICPDKGTADEWLAVHRIAHRMGLSSNATMLYGHAETIGQRVDHLDRLRRLQDEAPGFDAFIPLKYRSRHNRMSELGECSVEEDLRTMAMSRIYLDNIPHIKAYWVACGAATAEMALLFGADDLDGTIDDSTKIYSMAGADSRPSMSVEQIRSLAASAGFRAVERDTHYRPVAIGRNDAATPAAADVVREPVKPAEESSEQLPRRAVDKPAAVAAAVPAVEPVAESAATVAGAGEVKPSRKTSPPVQPERPRAKEPATPIRTEKKPFEKMQQRDRDIARATQVRKPARAAHDSRAHDGFWERLNRFRKRYPVVAHLIYIIITLLLLVLALNVGLGWGTRHGKTISVPNFVGLGIEEARGEAARMDLDIVVQDSIFDADVAGGVVVEQLPRHGHKRDVVVKPGRKIYVTINAYNRRTVTVPFVAKQSLRQAKNQLERAGLIIKELIYEPDRVATDYVLREEIGGRQILSSSSPVTVPYATGVTLYVGYEPSKAMTVVPKVIGMRLSQAQSTLWDNGLNVGEIVYDQSVKDFKERREAKVYKQSLHQNQGARRGARVTLYLTCDDDAVTQSAKRSEAEALQYERQRRQREREYADSLSEAETVSNLLREMSGE
ncbi:MAG: CofH family radical SAM protein [Alistipes sp.]|nr:CofH family radical SAM protein [Alistipes sp.]